MSQDTLAALGRERAHALIVNNSAEHSRHRELIVELVARGKLPTLYAVRAFPESGGLMAYAIDEVDLYSRAADQVAQILKGAKVESIPFYQATTFHLIINMRTAKAARH